MQKSYMNYGAEYVIFNLIVKFYSSQVYFPLAAGIRSMHTTELGSVKQNLFKFNLGLSCCISNCK